MIVIKIIICKPNKQHKVPIDNFVHIFKFFYLFVNSTLKEINLVNFIFLD